MCAQGRRGDPNGEVSMVTRTAGAKMKGPVTVVSAPLSFPRSLSFSLRLVFFSSADLTVRMFSLLPPLHHPSRSLVDVISLFPARCHAPLVGY